MRSIILHYHLFKNAGTSLDRILKNNFGHAWVTEEFPMATGNNTHLVKDWIEQNPDAIAFSSHTMVGPLPRVDGIRLIPMILLRDPIARIRSAYQFERNQDADTWGAQLAKEHDLTGYVRARLARNGDRQCRNFQTSRLSTLMPGDAPEVERAIAAGRLIQEGGILGRVEDFDASIDALNTYLPPIFAGFKAEAVRANVSAKSKSAGGAAQNEIVTNLLKDANADDYALLAALSASS
jgi:hypothetical protein